jgi:ABC-type transport system involved in cytochrome bd biosynthesis fused ATPase/permease subunit
MQVGVILVGSFMVYVPGLLICAALSFAIFVLRVLAHRAAQKGVAHE